MKPGLRAMLGREVRRMGNQTIKCTVEECRYWEDGNLCGLPSIEVKRHGRGAIDSLTAAITGEGRTTETDTYCASFDPR